MGRKASESCESWTLASVPCTTEVVLVEAVTSKSDKQEGPYFVHESAYVDDGAEIGAGTKIWHFSHVMNGARIGERCVIGQNVNVDRRDRHRKQRQDSE